MNKNKIVLVNPNLFFETPLTSGAYPGTAIMVLATILYEAGFEVKVIDGRYHKIDEAVRLILNEADERLTFVGFSVMTAHVPWAYHVSEAIKLKSPDTTIVWGGVHPTLFPEQTAEDPFIDIVVAGDAAASIVKLSHSLSEGTDLFVVPGIFYRKNANIIKTQPNSIKDNFNDVPFIDFSLIDHLRYSRNNSMANEIFYRGRYKNSRMYPVITALGCNYKCKFCINVILKKGHCYREAGEIIDRIKFLQSNYGANFIQPLDENFFFSKKRIFDFLDLLEKENINIKWRPQLRVDCFREDYINLDLAKRLERLGMVVAVMGAESASQKTLDKLDKRFEVGQIIKSAELLSKTNIIPKMSFIVGMPGETQADIRKTFKRNSISVVAYRPYPGSELFNEAVSEYGYVLPSNLREWAMISEKDLSEHGGYEAFDKYKWIPDVGRLKAMQYTYRRINSYRPGILSALYSIRDFLGFLSFDFDFFYFAYLEILFHRMSLNLKDILFRPFKKRSNMA